MQAGTTWTDRMPSSGDEPPGELGTPMLGGGTGEVKGCVGVAGVSLGGGVGIDVRGIDGAISMC